MIFRQITRGKKCKTTSLRSVEGKRADRSPGTLLRTPATSDEFHCRLFIQRFEGDSSFNSFGVWQKLRNAQL
ncbi:hypothetical protein B5X24_HaOG202402 [Helicoverpa armigera]|nr:hypothetical protein B5X24_HaOG202402 [Helicoverpa armigera]